MFTPGKQHLYFRIQWAYMWAWDILKVWDSPNCCDIFRDITSEISFMWDSPLGISQKRYHKS